MKMGGVWGRGANMQGSGLGAAVGSSKVPDAETAAAAPALAVAREPAVPLGGR